MKIEKGRELLYLSRADVVGCAVSPADANAAIAAGFVAKSAGRAQSRPERDGDGPGSRRRETAEAFADLARGKGLEATSVTDPRDAIADVDIVVSSVPIRPSRSEFLDASWTAPGTFVSMVDVGFSWRRETLRAFDRVVTEDIDQGIGSRGLHFGKPIDTDLAGIMSDKKATPQSSTERIAFVFAGTGLADVVLASLVFGRALERGIGRILPL